MRLPILLLLIPICVFTSEKLNRLTEEEKKELKKTLSQIVPVKIDKPPKNAEVDLFEVNEKNGVSGKYFHGDLELTDKQWAVLNHTGNKDSSRGKRQASTEVKKWTNNTVYYFFDSSINDRKKASVAAALDLLQQNTCIRFVYSSTASNRVNVSNGIGCNSQVGMRGGQQNLILGDGSGCEMLGAVAHEFIHALGFYHTQQRSDRDSYVAIDNSSIQPGKLINFERLKPEHNKITVPYEFGGLMHYPANAFVKKAGRVSIFPRRDSRYTYTMGSNQMSFYDIKMINDHYECHDKCSAASSTKCANGGLPNPNNCSACICPHGYGGEICTQRPTGCGETLAATSAWQTKTFHIGNNYDGLRDDFTYCNHWIKAPVGDRVQVKITNMFNTHCNFGCPIDGIEFKVDPDPRLTSPRFCCDEFKNKVFTSLRSHMPIVSYKRYNQIGFTIEYRAFSVNGVTQRDSSTATAAAPLVKTNCKNFQSDETCAVNVISGFCTLMPKYTFQAIKYNCGKACGLCGKAASPCVDTHPQCVEMKAAGMCSSLPPMEAEYHCAKTCGFCENPN